MSRGVCLHRPFSSLNQKMKMMLTKIYKYKLLKVCKVLFPKYKFIKIDLISKAVTFSNCQIPIIKWFIPSWRVSLTELLNYQIPNQMADFKWGNKSFISLIQEDLVRCELLKQNKIDYFLEEVTKVKCSDVYKQLNVVPERINRDLISNEEDEMFEDMIRMYEQENTPEARIRIPYWVSREAIFYTFLLIIVTYVLLINIRP